MIQRAEAQTIICQQEQKGKSNHIWVISKYIPLDLREYFWKPKYIPSILREYFLKRKYIPSFLREYFLR